MSDLSIICKNEAVKKKVVKILHDLKISPDDIDDYSSEVSVYDYGEAWFKVFPAIRERFNSWKCTIWYYEDYLFLTDQWSGNVNAFHSNEGNYNSVECLQRAINDPNDVNWGQNVDKYGPIVGKSVMGQLAEKYIEEAKSYKDEKECKWFLSECLMEDLQIMYDSYDCDVEVNWEIRTY